jgi:hypothetical protein
LGKYEGTDWELGEHVRNVMIASWELDGNTVGPQWEPKRQRNTPLSPSPTKTKPRRKKLNPLSLLVGCMKCPFPKRFVTICLDLYPHYRLALLTKSMVSSVDDPLFAFS